MSHGIAYSPKDITEFVGNKTAISIAKNAIDASKITHNPIPHSLISGSFGLGKTTLGECISAEITDIPPRIITGPALVSIQDVVTLMTNLKDNQLLIIDEVHGLRRDLQELFYEVMEKYRFHFVDRESKTPITVRTPKITIIGCTTDEGKLATPFLSRFRIKLRLSFYTPLELQKIVLQAARSEEIDIDSNSAFEIAKRSNGIARVALQNLYNIYDFAVNHNEGVISIKIVKQSFDMLGINDMGLSDDHRTILIALAKIYNGKPIGLHNLAQNVMIGAESIERIIEPYLIHIGLVERTPRGRQLTKKGSTLANKLISQDS